MKYVHIVFLKQEKDLTQSRIDLGTLQSSDETFENENFNQLTSVEYNFCKCRFQNSHDFVKDAFPVFSLITYQEINILLFGVFMILGKQKTPGDIPPGVFLLSPGKAKISRWYITKSFLFSQNYIEVSMQ